jgi:hypothetical protein
VSYELDARLEYMPFEDKVDYIINNRDSLPNDLVDRAINILVQAGEIEHARLPWPGIGAL